MRLTYFQESETTILGYYIFYLDSSENVVFAAKKQTVGLEKKARTF